MQPANSTGMKPRTTDDVSNTNNRCHCGSEADGGVRWFGLTGFQRDLIVEIYQMEQPSGQDIRWRLEAEHGEVVTTTRLYSNLDDLVDYGLIDKGEQDLRTNYYDVTNDGGQAAVSHGPCVKHRCCSCHRIFDSVNGADCPHCSGSSICSSENREECQ